MRLRERRRAQDLTQQFVADQLGITQASYQAYEGGKTMPTAEKLVLLADLFDVTTDYLLGRQ